VIVETLTAKGALIVGHAAGPYVIAGANAVAPHIVSTTAALHAHVTASGMHPSVIAASKALHGKATGVADGLATRAGHAAAKKAVVEAAKQGGGTPLRAPIVNYHHALGAGAAGGSIDMHRAAKFVGEVAASLAGRALLQRALQTETAARMVERTCNSPTSVLSRSIQP